MIYLIYIYHEFKSTDDDALLYCFIIQIAYQPLFDIYIMIIKYFLIAFKRHSVWILRNKYTYDYLTKQNLIYIWFYIYLVIFKNGSSIVSIDISNESKISGIIPNGHQKLNWTNAGYIYPSTTLSNSDYRVGVHRWPFIMLQWKPLELDQLHQ